MQKNLTAISLTTMKPSTRLSRSCTPEPKILLSFWLPWTDSSKTLLKATWRTSRKLFHRFWPDWSLSGLFPGTSIRMSQEWRISLKVSPMKSVTKSRPKLTSPRFSGIHLMNPLRSSEMVRLCLTNGSRSSTKPEEKLRPNKLSRDGTFRKLKTFSVLPTIWRRF